MPPLDEIRPHLIYDEKEPMFNREEKLKFFLGLEDKDELALLDITGESGVEEEKESEETEAGEEEEGEDPGEGFQPHRWWAIAVREGESKKKVRRYFSDKSDDSVKVRCETPKEGLKKAAEYFDEPPENLAVKILEEGSKGILGFGKKDYLIRVIKKEVLEQEEEEEGEEDVETFDLLAEAEEEEDVAGFINLENSADGLKLTVYPPQGHGLPVTMEQVKDELEESGYEQDINWPKVEQMVEEQAGETEKIAPRQRDPEIDGSFSVNLNEKETAAYLTVIPPKPEGVAVSEEEVLEYLESEGINYDQEKVKEVFEEEMFEEEILVAEGKEPDHGRDAELDFKVDIAPGEEGEEEEGEEDVDYRKGEEIVSAQEGDVLVEKIPATEGEPGLDVYGNEIPPEVGEDLEISAGDNVHVSEDNTQYIADEDGRVRYRDGEVLVEPVFIIEGDLDYEVGNVGFEGVVIVKGMILDGFKVEASQRIEAESVGKAVVECEGDVVLDKGMVGRDEGILKAGGDIFAKYIENSRVQADGSVVVEEAIMHSEVDAGEYVIVKGQRRGDIVGGVTRAGKAISAEDIGSAMASKTELAVGIDPKIRDRIREIEELIEEQKLRLTKIKNGLQGIKEQANKLGGVEELPEEKQDKRVQLVSRAKAVRKKMENLGEELQELRQKIQGSDGGEVYCRGDISDGVKLTIQTATMHLTEPQQNVRYGMVDGEIKKQAYKEFDVEIERPES
ncbi:MAG: FapA family protein [bacterium]